MLSARDVQPEGKKIVNGAKITLAQHASRMNIKLLRPAEFNEKLRECEADKRMTVRKICKACRDEAQVRKMLGEIRGQPSHAWRNLEEAVHENGLLFAFENLLDQEK